MFHILDNDFMLCLPGSTWKMEDADPSAIYYPTSFSNEAEALSYGEAIARQVSEEGIVLLTNQTEMDISTPSRQRTQITVCACTT